MDILNGGKVQDEFGPLSCECRMNDHVELLKHERHVPGENCWEVAEAVGNCASELLTSGASRRSLEGMGGWNLQNQCDK